MPDSPEVGRRSVSAFPRTLLEFQRLFSDEAACAAYLETVRWPGGFVCLHCNWGGEPWRPKRQATVLRCAAWRRLYRGEWRQPDRHGLKNEMA